MRVSSQFPATAAAVIQVASFSSAYSGNFIASLKAGAIASEKCGLRTVWVFPEAARIRPWFQQLRQEAKPVYTLAGANGRMRDALQLAEIAKAENAAIIHTHFSHYDVAAWVARAIPIRRPPALIWHVHSDFTDKRNWLRLVKDTVKLRLMGRTCHLVTVSEALCRDHVQRGFPSTRAHVVPNGVDAERATRTTQPRILIRRELNIADTTLMLLGFGWTPVIKGVDTMLEALDQLIVGGMKAVLVLVGTDELREFVAHWPAEALKSPVRVLAPMEAVGDLYSAADMFISASRSEGWPYSIAEAMANGVPVASTRIPGVSWAADAPGITFFQAGDSQGLAQAIQRIAGRPDADAHVLAELSRAFVRDRHGVLRWAESIAHLYEEVIGRTLAENRDALGSARQMTAGQGR